MKSCFDSLAGLKEKDFFYRKMSLMSAGSHVVFQVGLYDFCRLTNLPEHHHQGQKAWSGRCEYTINYGGNVILLFIECKNRLPTGRVARLNQIAQIMAEAGTASFKFFLTLCLRGRQLERKQEAQRGPHLCSPDRRGRIRDFPIRFPNVGHPQRHGKYSNAWNVLATCLSSLSKGLGTFRWYELVSVVLRSVGNMFAGIQILRAQSSATVPIVSTATI